MEHGTTFDARVFACETDPAKPPCVKTYPTKIGVELEISPTPNTNEKRCFKIEIWAWWKGQRFMLLGLASFCFLVAFSSPTRPYDAMANP